MNISWMRSSTQMILNLPKSSSIMLLSVRGVRLCSTLPKHFLYNRSQIFLRLGCPRTIYGSTSRSMLTKALLSLIKTLLLICLNRSSYNTFFTRGLTPLIPSILMTKASLAYLGRKSFWTSLLCTSTEFHPSPSANTPSHIARHA